MLESPIRSSFPAIFQARLEPGQPGHWAAGAASPLANGDMNRSHSLDDATSMPNIDWWSPASVPAQNLDFHHHQQHSSPFQSAALASPRPYHIETPHSDSFVLQQPTFAFYHGSPFQGHRAPVSRSMSVSALSATEPNFSNHTSGSTVPPPRQIRFVSTDGQPHTKRRRINAACLTCRRRKTRCSGERPQCSTCTDAGHVCTGYVDRAQRGDDSKFDEDGEEDENSGASSPKRHKTDNPSKSNNLMPKPKLEKTSSAESAASVRSGGGRDDFRDVLSPASNYTANSNSSASRNRVPYFRYFGPTAIVPGFKQMVVALKDHRRSLPSQAGDSPASVQPFDTASIHGPSPPPAEIPFYDATDPSPNAPLITSLCELFFTHIGCNYPFLQKERFLRDLEEKKVDAILVDAVCAVAARFSSDPLLTHSVDDSIPRENEKNEVRKAFRGHPFAHRAMSTVADTFACPTIAVSQACLLLAYDEFGIDHDSGLWMYLGTAIRMAQDLGVQKLDGLQMEGRLGPTPKTAKNGEEGRKEELRRIHIQKKLSQSLSSKDEKDLEDRRASEQERIDTFWSIFFLDRAVSSGVGRPVTLRDKDIELSFPYRDDASVNGYPDPFPPMLRIVHMYGRVADVLNNIKDINQVTPDVLKQLASMEKDLTGIYQRLPIKLHFNATNFQHYVKAEQGTNFILLHFWFHTLIVLLHQPTLLHSFEGKIQQLFPDSRELSMSSAKTIADILAFAELIDVKSFIGNPFTSQPMYVAACAFLAEASAHASQPPSRASSPPSSGNNEKSARDKVAAANAKYTLLASAANQNYQRCYKALQTLDSYWAGCRYILTALDQKSKGLMSPLLYTSQDVDGPMPSTEPSFTTPGWRRSTSHSASMGASALNKFRSMRGSQGEAWSPTASWSQAIGWSLSGTTNSPQPNLSFLYPNTSPQNTDRISSAVDGTPSMLPDTHNNQPSHQNPYLAQNPATPSYPSPSTSMMPPPSRNPPSSSSLPYDPVSTAEADLLLGLQSPYSVNSGSQPTVQPTSFPNQHVNSAPEYDFSPQQAQVQPHMHAPNDFQKAFLESHQPNYSDMLIESQDVDMSGTHNFNFAGSDMIPWLEYLPQDVLSYFGDSGEEVMASAHGLGPGPPSAGDNV